MLDLSPEREACIDIHLIGVPPDIGNLTNLRVLMLDTNQLSELPREIGQLSQLERISVSNNLLARLPDSISNLGRLESLHAANNRLVAVFAHVLLRLMCSMFLLASPTSTSSTVTGRRVRKDTCPRLCHSPGGLLQHGSRWFTKVCY